MIGSAADEAAEHHNQPGALPDVIVVNSVNAPDTLGGVGATNVPPSYLQLNGCTNWGPRVVLSVASASCSSNATGLSAGVTGLVYSAAEDAIAAGRLTASDHCRTVAGTPCVVTPNEVRQLLASGNIAGDATPGQPASSGRAPADEGNGGQADDVNFAASPEPSCAQQPLPTCTDPNLSTMFAPDMLGGVLGPAPDTFQYPARRGYDEFYGYGRLNAYKAVQAAFAGNVPPEADITAPDWFAQIDPSAAGFPLDGFVDARVPYTCEVAVAPGVQPNNAPASGPAPGDFHPVASTYCDGLTVHRGPFHGELANVSVPMLKALFPPANPTSFTGNADGGIPQDAFGRPNTQPYAFTVRVLVSTAAGVPMTGEDRRQLYLHRDGQSLPGWPRELRSDGDSSPLLIDLEGDDRNDLVVATSDGVIHAFRPNGSEAPGWPVHTAPLPLHLGEAAFGHGGVGAGHHCAVLGGLAAGDLFHNGELEVVADDMCGNVYAWNGQGRLVFHAHANPAFSGGPLGCARDPACGDAPTRSGPRDRTADGFIGAPVLANLRGGPGPLDVIAAGEDRHLYAWRPDGRPVPGFPVLVEDPDKITALAPRSQEPVFSTVTAEPNPSIAEDQGKIVDTPAVAYVDGPNRPPVIYVGTNEEYTVGRGDEGPINASLGNSASLGLIGQLGVLQYANGRVYAIKPTGGQMVCAGGHCHSTAFEPGWPVKVGIIDEGLLPDVGEGIDGSPVVAPLDCPAGGYGEKIAVSPDAGPAYVLNPNGTSCYGQTGGQDTTLATDAATGNGEKVDSPVFPAVGYPAFGTLDDHTLSLFDQGAGLIRALDVVLNGEQKGGQDFILGWNPQSGQFDGGYPAVTDDLGFLTGEVVGQITGAAGTQDVLGGTSSLELYAFNASGQPASAAWPKLTGDWLVATPVLGSFGTLDFRPGASRDVVSVTRSGTLAVYATPAPACSPASWPNWHHDIANSGDYERQATPPGTPADLSRHGRTLSFLAPGASGECGRAAAYEVVTSNRPITAGGFGRARRLPAAALPVPALAGTVQKLTLPRRIGRYLAIRAVGPQGALGPPQEILLAGAGPTATGRTRQPPAGCVALSPLTAIRRLTRRRLTGVTHDASCGTAGLRRLLIEGGGPSPFVITRSLHARPGRPVSFSVVLPRHLRRGVYHLTVLATDAAGRTEIARSLDTATLRVR